MDFKNNILIYTNNNWQIVNNHSYPFFSKETPNKIWIPSFDDGTKASSARWCLWDCNKLWLRMESAEGYVSFLILNLRKPIFHLYDRHYVSVMWSWDKPNITFSLWVWSGGLMPPPLYYLYLTFFHSIITYNEFSNIKKGNQKPLNPYQW